MVLGVLVQDQVEPILLASGKKEFQVKGAGGRGGLTLWWSDYTEVKGIDKRKTLRAFPVTS